MAAVKVKELALSYKRGQHRLKASVVNEVAFDDDV